MVARTTDTLERILIEYLYRGINKKVNLIRIKIVVDLQILHTSMPIQKMYFSPSGVALLLSIKRCDLSCGISNPQIRHKSKMFVALVADVFVPILPPVERSPFLEQ